MTEADYEAKLQKWMVYHENLSEEEVKKLHPLEDYIIESYAEIICSEIDQYTIRCFKNKMNPLR